MPPELNSGASSFYPICLSVRLFVCLLLCDFVTF